MSFSSFCRDRRKQPHRHDTLERAVIVDRYRMDAHSYTVLSIYEYAELAAGQTEELDVRDGYRAALCIAHSEAFGHRAQRSEYRIKGQRIAGEGKATLISE